MKSTEQNQLENDGLSDQVESASAQQIELSLSSIKSIGAPGRFTLMHAVLLLNLLMLSGFGSFAVLMFHRLKKVDSLPEVRILSPHSAQAAQGTTSSDSGAKQPSQIVAVSISDNSDISNEAVSLETARQYFQQKAYLKAYYVYEKLQENISGRQLQQQCLRDWLSVRMALCLYLAQPKTEISDHFTQALQSRSFFVRMVANYYLSLIQNENGQFLEARSRAYQALGLLKAVEQFMPETMAANCYFIAAESLTSHVLSMHNQNPLLDGQNWTRFSSFVDFSVEDQQQLKEMLMVRVEETGQASLAPRVEYYPNRSVGSQWTGISLDTPLEQLFWRVASEADLVVSWGMEAQQDCRKPTTLYLPFVDRQYLLEVIAAGAGLIWRYDGQMGVIHDPANDEDFQACKQVMCQEAISMWQRFLIRYRTDFRVANAHYCLGKLYEIDEDPSTALGHYKLVYSQLNQDELAPYALFNASRVKSSLHDYAGAKDDLNELLIHYPNFKVIGKAILHLADISMKCGLYEEAAGMYERAFHMDISDDIRRSALFGRGQCAFECEDYEGCIQWLSQALEMTSDVSDIRRGSACLMLGRSLGRLGKHEQAAQILQMTLGGTLAREDYVEIIFELIEVECKRENYLTALQILESIPANELSQEDICRFLLVKSNIYCMLDLTDTSISLLRRQIEFIADARLRAQLALELAYCYMLKGDLDVAQRELNDAMYDLPAGFDTQRGGYLLARMAYLEGDFDKSERLCFQTLQTHVQDDVLRNQVYELLGDIYTKQKDFNNAALAYAGVIDKGLLH